MVRLAFCAALLIGAGTASAAAFGPIADKPSSDGYFTGYVEVTNGFGATSAGTISIRASQINYQSGAGNKIAIIPSNNAFLWDGIGTKPGMSCNFRTSGNAIGGGGYLAAGTGTVLDCVVSSGNGGARRETTGSLTYVAD
jgi:hypothetical protein